jgi:prepilin peptidase CpaA
MLDPLQALTLLLSGLTVFSDLYARRVRNTWLLAVLLLGMGWMGWMWMQGTAGPPWRALAGLLIGLLVLLPGYVIGWVGAGDVKLFATLGFLLGGKALLPIWIIGSLLGGLHAAIVLGVRHWVGPYSPGMSMQQMSIRSTWLWQRVTLARQGRVGLPYAAYMAVGALCTIFVPHLMRW